ncbi:MAG: diguanylate cyclase [Thermotogaceae bacterium]|nr:diguanylate cyclase [Thermotogaceae bacterium]
MERKRVLVVDDGMLWRTFISDIAKKGGHEVLTAKDGLDGYNKAMEFVPDVAFIDVEMPVIKGYTLCRLLRNEEAFKEAGLIIMTSLGETLNKFWALKAGATDFLKKGEPQDRIISFVKEILSRSYRSRPELLEKSVRPKFEELNHLLENIIFKETVIKEVYSLFSYISDEEHVFWKLSDFINLLIMPKNLAIMVLNPQEGVLFISSREKDLNVSKVREFLFSKFSRPTFPAGWKYLGDTLESGDYMPDFKYYPFKDGDQEVGILAVEGDIPREGDDILREITMHLGKLFKLMISYSVALKQAKYDELTGLLNYRTVIEKLSEYFAFAKRNNQNLSIAMVDIDNFKKVNDTYGHPVGNEVLKELGKIMRNSFREVDILGRYGGEEFVIGMVNAELGKARQAVERLRENVEKNDWSKIQKDLKITVSIGVASSKNGRAKRSVLEIIEAADKALYVAKRTGKNKVVASEE